MGIVDGELVHRIYCTCTLISVLLDVRISRLSPLNSHLPSFISPGCLDAALLGKKLLVLLDRSLPPLDPLAARTHAAALDARLAEPQEPNLPRRSLPISCGFSC